MTAKPQWISRYHWWRWLVRSALCRRGLHYLGPNGYYEFNGAVTVVGDHLPAHFRTCACSKRAKWTWLV